MFVPDPSSIKKNYKPFPLLVETKVLPLYSGSLFSTSSSNCLVFSSLSNFPFSMPLKNVNSFMEIKALGLHSLQQEEVEHEFSFGSTVI